MILRLLFLQAHSAQFLEHLAELLKRHLLVALRVFLEDFDEEGAVDGGVQFGDFEILGEHHELVDGHDGGFVHDLLEGWVLAGRVAGLAVVVEDDSQVVLVLAGEVLEVELVGVAGEVVVGVVLVLLLGRVWVDFCLDLLEVVAVVGGFFFAVRMQHSLHSGLQFMYLRLYLLLVLFDQLLMGHYLPA